MPAYTRLESLLLFQSLHAYGVAPDVFIQISDLLKANPHITQDAHYEAARLSPDALRTCYLHILKDEIKSDAHAHDEPHADPPKPSRKRKLPSPTLPTLQDSLQHQHLIPKLLSKLYARYRQHVADCIAEDEDRYEALQRDLHHIDARLSPQDKTSPRKKPAAASQVAPTTATPTPTPTPTTATTTTTTTAANDAPHTPRPLGSHVQHHPSASAGPYQGFPQHLQFQHHGQPYGPHRVPQLAPSPANSNVQPQRSYLPMSGQPPYLPQHPQPGQPPPQGGFMLPPFQVAPQDPSPSHHQHPISTPANARQTPAKFTPHAARGPATPMQPPNRVSASVTPVNIRAIIVALSTPNTGRTAWKPTVASLGATPADRPHVSPIDDFESLQREDPEAKSKPVRKSRAKGKAKDKDKEPEESDQQSEQTVPESDTRPGRSARRKAPVKRARPGSIASSHTQTSLRGRSRSHSILSHTETIAADTETQAESRIKSEDVEDLAVTPSHMSTRGRAATRAGNKRKRSSPETEDRSGTPVAGLRESLRSPGVTPRRVVVAPRHFSRMCAPLINDITSHKHASTFTTPVKAKDAEGYYDIIKRPTDLKSIQKAIAAGAKQVAAAASSDSPAGTSSPGGSGGAVELPRTPEYVPPKAIVNSAQLERELMRMFVNAVMFNPGEGGVVEDAREMFEVVQRSVGAWRSVEGGRREVEVEETPEVEEDGPMEKKRRKL